MTTLVASSVAAAGGTAASCSINYNVCCFLQREKKEYRTSTKKKNGRGKEVRVIGNFSEFGDVVRKDFDFIKKGSSKGVDWANHAFKIPQVFKTLDDVLWLKNLEDSRAAPLEPQSWPHPSYPGLTGMDLLMADLKALEAYASYFYYLSKFWSKPLPEVYDPQDVADYFRCRPHVVVLRLLEVFSAVASATIRMRTSGMRKFLQPSSDRGINRNISQYNFGLVLKETMLNLGPTFIKVGQSLSTVPDIIGAEISKAYSELHDQIPPFPKTMAMKIIEEELCSPVESFFSYISEEPVAAATFGQVPPLAIVDSCFCSISPHCYSPKQYNKQTLTPTSTSQFLSSNSLLKLKKNTSLLPEVKLGSPISPNSRSFPVVFALQSTFFKVVQTVWKVGKDGIDAGTNLVPDSVPRPIARISVTIVALSVSLFVLKSVLSTAFFALATMGFVYFVFIALNKDQGPKGGGGGGSGGSTNSPEDALEEARRIMEKYK